MAPHQPRRDQLDVSVGSNSEVELADADFRFTPESRHPAVGLGCPFRAKRRLMHRNEQPHYSQCFRLDISNGWKARY